jgi:hypothetical protein
MWHYSPELKTILEEIDRQIRFGDEYVRVRHPQTGQTYQLPAACLQPVDRQKPLSADVVMVRAIAARITEALKNDVMLSPLEADIIPLPHQLYALNRAMERGHVRFLLADEVGLGKTIEAGLILRELKLRGEVERVLVLAPKSLLIQWVSEMETHFGETFTLVQPSAIDDDLWKMYPQVVVSIDSVKPMEKRHNWTPAQIDAWRQNKPIIPSSACLNVMLSLAKHLMLDGNQSSFAKPVLSAVEGLRMTDFFMRKNSSNSTRKRS